MSSIYQAPTIGNAILTVAASDSSDFARSRAQYRCDGTADEVQIQAAIDALPATGGTVYLAAGNYYISDTPITLDEGEYVIGEGMGATVIQPHASTTLTTGEALIELATDSNFNDGGLRDLHLMGDGGIDESAGYAQPDGTATIDGLDLTNVTTLASWDMTRVQVTRCRRGVNGETGNQRIMPVLDCVFWYNGVGFYCLEHPNFIGGEFRYNSVGIGGRPFDVNITNVRFSYNNIGIERTGETTGVENAFISSCAIFSSASTGVVLGAGSVVVGCYIGTGSVACAKGISVATGDCQIVGNRIAAQANTAYGWTDGAIYFPNHSGRHVGTLIDGNLFANHVGPAIGAETDGTTTGNKRGVKITNNTFRLYTGSATCVQFGGYYNYSNQFVGNSIAVNSSYNFGGAALVYIRNNLAGGNLIADNVVEFVSNTDCTNGYIFDGGLLNTRFINNQIRNADAFPVFTAAALASANSATRIQNNHILTSAGVVDGYRTRNKGTATVANGATTVDVTHGLSATPDSVVLTPTNNLGNASHYFVSDIGTTTFRINVDSDPGATTATFSWVASVYEGG